MMLRLISSRQAVVSAVVIAALLVGIQSLRQSRGRRALARRFAGMLRSAAGMEDRLVAGMPLRSWELSVEGAGRRRVERAITTGQPI